MQQDWKKVWDNLNPDEAAKERMKQAILQKMYAEAPPKRAEKTPFSLQRLRFGTFARAAALCCTAITIAVVGLQMSEEKQPKDFCAKVSEPAGSHTLPVTASPDEPVVVTSTAASTTAMQTTTVLSSASKITSEQIEVTTAEMALLSLEELILETEPLSDDIDMVETEPIVTDPVITEPTATETEPVWTTEPPMTEEIETTTTFRGVPTYGSLYDFQYARWNGVHYQTNYETVSYEELDDLAGFSVAIQAEGSRVYTILVYPLKGYSIQDCIAVQYAGDEDYFYFYAIS